MSLDDLYRHAWAALAPDGFTELDDVAPPRGPDRIFELIDALGLAPGADVLDLACGPGEQALVLAERYAARVIAIDPVVPQLVMARGSATAADRCVCVAAGSMEAIPLASESFTLVWLRDALLHSSDPEATLHGCFRVLRPGGHLLLHTAYATDLLAAHELELLETEMHVQRAALDAKRVDRAVTAAGFEPVHDEALGSELAEHYEQQDGLGSRALLRLARLNRSPGARARLGEERVRAARGLYHWVVFELLGKLSYRTRVLRRPAT